MKKFIFVVVSVFCLAGFSSCNKDWTCTCNIQGNPTPLKYTIKHLSKSSATTDCNNLVSTAEATGGGGTATCSI